MIGRFRFRAYFVAIASAVIWAWFAYRLSFEAVIPLILSQALLVFVALMTLIRVFTVQRRERWKELVSFGACAVSLGGYGVGLTIRDLDFRYRRLPRYAALVDKIKRGDVTAPEGDRVPIKLPPGDEDLAYCVRVSKGPTGVVMVSFAWGAGFPATRYLCYYYRTSGTWDADMANNFRRLDDKWFEGME